MKRIVAKEFSVRLQRWGRALDPVSAKYSWLLFRMFLLVCIIASIMVTISVGRDILEFRAAGRRNAITIPDISLPRTRHLPSVVGEETIAADSSQERIPDLDWYAEIHVKKAAALLAQAGDLQGAIAMLHTTGENHHVARKIADASVGRIRHNIKAIWLKEIRCFEEMWNGMTPEQRQRLFNSKRQDTIRLLDTAWAGELMPDKIDPHLPDSVRFVMMNNIHLQLVDASNAPGQIIELFMDAAFPTDSFAKTLYWKSEHTTLLPQADHAVNFAESVDRVFVWPRVKRLLEAERRELFAVSDSTLEWYEDVWGKLFVDGLRKFIAKTAKQEDAKVFWDTLKQPAKKFIAERLYTDHVEDMNMPLSHDTIRESVWLRGVADEVDDSHVLKSVRTYPGWQRSLRAFDYDQAKEQAENALQRIWAGKYFIRETNQQKGVSWERLTETLQSERDIMLSKGFVWRLLSNELGGVGEGIPEPVRRARKLKGAGRLGGKRWVDIPPLKIYQALLTLAARSPQRASYYDNIARLYAENRNL